MAAVFKIAKCKTCRAQRHESKPVKKPLPCKKCGGETRYLDNWYISYQINGVKKVEAAAPQLRMSQDILAKKQVDIREGKYFDMDPKTSWKKAVKSFEQYIQTNTRPGTVHMYKACLKVLAPHFKDYTLDQITSQMVEQFKAERLTQERQNAKRLVTKATVNREVATIKRLFSLAEEWGMVKYDHLRKVKLLREDNWRVRFLQEEEKALLLEECGALSESLRMIVLIALETGFRKTPIYTLEWKDVDFRRRNIENESKGGKIIKVPMTETLYNELLAWKKSQIVMSRWVFPAPGDPAKHVSIAAHRSFEKACVQAKIFDFRFHDLRHTFASHFLMRTKDIKTLQELLGHSDIKMTMRYSHLLDEHKRKAMEIFEKGAINQ